MVAVGIDVVVSVDLIELTVDGAGECLVSEEPLEDEAIVARLVDFVRNKLVRSLYHAPQEDESVASTVSIF